MKLDQIVELAKRVHTVYISGHINPDGDCVGATMSMAMLLEKKGIHAKILLADIPGQYHFLPLGQYVTDQIPSEIDMLIVMDSGALDRLGTFEECFHKAAMTVNIDHHSSNTMFAQHNHVVPEASSTCEVLFEMITDESLLDQQLAIALYTGIIYDTGVFKHSCTSERTHQIAGKLIRYGFDFSDVIDRLFYSRTYTGLKTLSKAIENIQSLNDGKWVFSHLTEEEVVALNTSKKQTDSIVQVMNEIKGVEVAVFCYEMEPDVFKVSLRSKGTINVCEVAKSFGGGGHIKASGCTVNGNVNHVVEQLLVAFRVQERG